MDNAMKRLLVRNIELEITLVEFRNFFMIQAEKYAKSPSADDAALYKAMFQQCCDVLAYHSGENNV
jgi:hypothetical protein